MGTLHTLKQHINLLLFTQTTDTAIPLDNCLWWLQKEHSALGLCWGSGRGWHSSHTGLQTLKMADSQARAKPTVSSYPWEPCNSPVYIQRVFPRVSRGQMTHTHDGTHLVETVGCELSSLSHIFWTNIHVLGHPSHLLLQHFFALNNKTCIKKQRVHFPMFTLWFRN